MSESIFYSVKLLEKQTVAESIVVLRFAKPVGFSFVPGQFVQVRAPDVDGFALRSYSISSSPNDPYVELCVKILPGGKASYLFDNLMPGESIEVSNAKGFFVVKPEDKAPKFFIATGTGIAPVLPMVAGVISGGGMVKLLFGVRSETDMFWVERFESLKKSNSNFDFAITLSQPSLGWMGLKGRVTDHVSAIDLDASYYLCGSADMVKDVRAILIAGGLSTKSIHLEIF